jgi:hypothetical protein
MGFREGTKVKACLSKIMNQRGDISSDALAEITGEVISVSGGTEEMTKVRFVLWTKNNPDGVPVVVEQWCSGKKLEFMR